MQPIAEIDWDISQLSLAEVEGELFRRDFRQFIPAAWHVIDSDPYRHNWHIDAIAEHLQWVLLGEITRLMIMMPPRMGKSIGTGVMFPAYAWVVDPRIKMITGSYDQTLSIRDARKSRQLIMSNWYQQRFIRTLPADDQWSLIDRFTRQRQDFYTNTKNGHRVAISTDGRTTGEGGSIFLIDDPLNAKAAVKSELDRKNAIDWYNWAARSRLNNQNTDSVILNAQRTHGSDLHGYLLEEEGRIESGGEWVVLELPNEYNPKKRCIITIPGLGETFRDPREVEGELLCPERLGRKATEGLKKGMEDEYNSQYQQQPISDDGLILKRSYWRKWQYPKWHPEHGSPMPLPHVHTVVAVFDTAFEEKQANDESACTIWGLFEHHEDQIGEDGRRMGKNVFKQAALLLGAWHDRVEFPELRKKAREITDEFDCDLVLVEKKASGHSLIHELRFVGVPVRGVKVGSSDKVERARISVTPLSDGRVYYIPGKSYAEEVVDLCARFPKDPRKDIVDTCVIAWAYMRVRGMVGANAEPNEDGDIEPFEEIKRQESRPLYS